MQILLANAKIMFDKTDRKPLSTPLFQNVADTLGSGTNSSMEYLSALAAFRAM